MIRLLLIAVLLAAASPAHAQSVPPITRSKQVATKAADAASNRVRAQTSVTEDEPSAKAPAASDAKAPGTRATSPDSSAGRTPPGRTPPGRTPPGRTPPGRTPPGGTSSGSARSAAAAGTAVDSVRPEGAARTNELVLMREVYRYDEGGRRDPFVSLMESGDLRPVVSDLRLIGVIYDPTGRRSLATLRDATTNELYRVAVGNVLGRTRITHIQPKQVTMTIEEFGFSRQLVLILGDTTDTRTQR